MSGQHTEGKLKAVMDDLMLTTGRYRMARGITACGSSKGMIDERQVSLANARRLAAAWNACEGMKTEHIEALFGCGTIGDLRANELAAAHALLRETLAYDDQVLAYMKSIGMADRLPSYALELTSRIRSYLDACDTLGEKA